MSRCPRSRAKQMGKALAVLAGATVMPAAVREECVEINEHHKGQNNRRCLPPGTACTGGGREKVKHVEKNGKDQI
ncbi:hypothetical protein KOW79_014450 [Hemibagrus wyckioides]|uniref:Uncharacterized protein n=1 Tax=Hemibagrus wyckioides TaxID=337641 RepID=A0A9D3SEU7_9TELE|nr:hypothetical protein KOW79_014450 [Hemibagrus wyckioides]